MDNILDKFHTGLTKEIELIKKEILKPFQTFEKNNYKDGENYEERCSESFRILCKYPSYVPIIVDYVNFGSYNNIKNKFLVSKDSTLSEFLYSIRKQLKLNPYEAIFIYFDNILIENSKTMGEIYNNYLLKNKSSDDKFLYATVSKETTFGY
jgi:hypothetical protein